MAGGLMVSQVLGSQRSILDRVVIRNAKKMPVTALIKKGPTVDNMMYEWPLDIYDDARANAVAEGKDVDAFDNQAKNYAVVANRVQWVRRPWMVGKLAQDVQNQAGISDKRAYQVKKALDHLMQDIEAAICSDNDVVAGSGALADQARAIGTWISSSITTSGYTVDASPVPLRASRRRCRASRMTRSTRSSGRPGSAAVFPRIRPTSSSAGRPSARQSPA